ncbi:hypothetical protein [Sphingomonas jaspsi]|uniref:hypothetical protein n=1 Tax=Sphingomonas jaspsi TaxID=392409 RepID=UPI0004B7EE5B|nr:hypothetical protein [Sphingomonas jaspsi]
MSTNPNDLLRDPAVRALIATAMVSDARDDLRVPCVVAAWALEGPLSIVPAAVASAQPDDRPTFVGKERSTLADRQRRDREDFEQMQADEREAERMAEGKLRAQDRLNRCAEAFLDAVKQFEPAEEEEDRDLKANLTAIAAWLREQGSSSAKEAATAAADAAAAVPDTPTQSSQASQSVEQTGAAAVKPSTKKPT